MHAVINKKKHTVEETKNKVILSYIKGTTDKSNKRLKNTAFAQYSIQEN